MCRDLRRAARPLLVGAGLLLVLAGVVATVRARSADTATGARSLQALAADTARVYRAAARAAGARAAQGRTAARAEAAAARAAVDIAVTRDAVVTVEQPGRVRVPGVRAPLEVPVALTEALDADRAARVALERLVAAHERAAAAADTALAAWTTSAAADSVADAAAAVVQRAETRARWSERALWVAAVVAGVTITLVAARAAR
jgi:hypothetical protein